MKRFFNILLVAVLVVTSLATVAAAQEAQPGETVDITVTVTGEFTSFLIDITADEGLTIESISNAGAYAISSATSAKANWAGASDVTSHDVIVKVKVASDIAPGTYYVTGTYVSAYKDAENGEVTPTVVTVTGGSVTIPEPECEHAWGEGVETKAPTCTEEGEMTYTCTKCGETKTEPIPATGHAYGEWKETKAPTCTEKGEEERSCKCGHTESRDVDALGHDYKNGTCTRCGEKDPNYMPPTDDGELDDIPQTGDISTQVYMTVAVVLVLMTAAAAFVFKRRTAK